MAGTHPIAAAFLQYRAAMLQVIINKNDPTVAIAMQNAMNALIPIKYKEKAERDYGLKRPTLPEKPKTWNDDPDRTKYQTLLWKYWEENMVYLEGLNAKYIEDMTRKSLS